MAIDAIPLLTPEGPAPLPPPPVLNTTVLATPAPKRRAKSIDLIIEKAAESALKANTDRKHAEEVAQELKTKVAQLTKKLQAVEKMEKRNAAIIQTSPATETEETKSWFKRVERGSKLSRGDDAKGRKWAAIREEERMARAAQIKASEDRPAVFQLVLTSLSLIRPTRWACPWGRRHTASSTRVSRP